MLSEKIVEMAFIQFEAVHVFHEAALQKSGCIFRSLTGESEATVAETETTGTRPERERILFSLQDHGAIINNYSIQVYSR